MLTRRCILIPLALLAAETALAQANLKPDTTPRVPPQPGQGLPAEDRRFLERALNLSRAEVDATKLAADKASDARVKVLATELAREHARLVEALGEHASRYKVQLPQPASRAAWGRDLESLAISSGGQFDREYISWQLRTHLALVDLYQTQASHSPDADLAKFAITTLAEIKPRFETLKRIGAEQGLRVETVGQPPQY